LLSCSVCRVTCIFYFMMLSHEQCRHCLRIKLMSYINKLILHLISMIFYNQWHPIVSNDIVTVHLFQSSLVAFPYLQPLEKPQVFIEHIPFMWWSHASRSVAMAARGIWISPSTQRICSNWLPHIILVYVVLFGLSRDY